MGAEEIAAPHDPRVAAALDQGSRFILEPAQRILEPLGVGTAARADGSALAQGQFDWQELPDRNRLSEFVVPGAVDDPETTAAEHRFQRVFAQRRAKGQRVASVVVACLHRVGHLPTPVPAPPIGRCLELCHVAAEIRLGF